MVDEAHSIDDDARAGQALGARGSLESFGGDHALERGVGEREYDIEEEIRRQGALSVGVLDVVSLGVEGGRKARISSQSCGARYSTVYIVSYCGLVIIGVRGCSPSVPRTNTLRRGMVSVSATAVRAPTADRTELSRLYASCCSTEVTPMISKMVVLK